MHAAIKTESDAEYKVSKCYLLLYYYHIIILITFLFT